MATSADYERIFTLLYANVSGQALAVALDLKIADKIDSGLSDPELLAEDLGADVDNLTRLLRGLVALGLCTENDDGHFTLTESGSLLNSTKPDSLARLVQLTLIDIGDLVTWHEMKSTVLSGVCAFKERNGRDFFGYLTEHPELYENLNQAMRQGSQLIAKVIAATYEFPEGANIMDIGGGDGTLISTILAAHPQLTGTLLDTAAGVANAAATVAAAGVESRCTITAGDFFESIPGGVDIYLTKSVLHDWDDDSARRILLNCRRAMADGAKLVILEPALDDSATEQSIVYSRLSDLNMMTALGGRERSVAEFTRLCRDAGLDVTRVRRLDPFDLSMIEAVPTSDCGGSR